MNEKTIRRIFAENNVPISVADAWEVQNVWVIKHSALERLAAALEIIWGEPKVIVARDDHFAIMVSATRPDKRVTEWSIGEARVVPMIDSGRKNRWNKPIYEPAPGAIGNYQISPRQAAYPAAMAEKRGKDRVILKLVGLHGAYSEEEADDFKRRLDEQAQRQIDRQPDNPRLGPPVRRDYPRQDDRRQPDRRDDRRDDRRESPRRDDRRYDR